jgi:hypothetical protein
MLTRFSFALVLLGCTATPAPSAPAPPEPVEAVVVVAEPEPYRWMVPAWKDTCRKVPTYGLGGRRARTVGH